MVIAVPAFLNMAFKLNLNASFFTGNKPNIAAGKPEIGQLGLPAVNKLLLKYACLIAD